jgi:tripartite-type tricarboxylate transporter receptor subunit TctC
MSAAIFRVKLIRVNRSSLSPLRQRLLPVSRNLADSRHRTSTTKAIAPWILWVNLGAITKELAVKKTLVTLIAALGIAVPTIVCAAYPDKPIRLVLPYSAGGGADNAGRLIAKQMTAAMGQSVVVDNRAGAGGVIGEEIVARAAPDGYTILFDASAITVNPYLYKLPFDPVHDLIPVSLAVTAAQILAVSPSSPYKTFADFVADATKHPNALTYASAGIGTASYLGSELMNDDLKLKIQHIPYKGGAPALVDLMGGRVTMYFGNVASTLNYVLAGKLKPLAVTSLARIASLPNVPTIAESGIAGFQVLEWNGLYVPKGTPPAIVQRLNLAIKTAVEDPDTRQKLVRLGLEPVGNTPEEFAAFMKSERTRWGALLTSRNIKPE